MLYYLNKLKNVEIEEKLLRKNNMLYVSKTHIARFNQSHEFFFMTVYFVPTFFVLSKRNKAICMELSILIAEQAS